MPETSNGGTGGRANTRSPGGPVMTPGPIAAPTGVPEGYVRVDLSGDGYVVFTFTDHVFTDLILEARLELGNISYFCESGRVWTVPDYFRWGDTVLSTDVTWTAGRARGGRIGGDRVFFPGERVARYMPGDLVQANDFGLSPEAMATVPPVRLRGAAGGCDCERCRERRRYEDPVGEHRRQVAAAAKTAEARQRAEVRAEETLRMVLLPDELAEYESSGKLIITGGDGEKYQIGIGLVHNVHLLDGDSGEMRAALCCHPTMYVNGYNKQLPYKDAHIAQVLYLRYDIDKFWETANVVWHDKTARRRKRNLP